MRFSNEYDKIQELDCFDPILIADTELFVDPFAVFEETEGFFSNSFEKMLRFFNQAFILAANANRDSKTISYKKLESMLMFPEINELGLGYSNTNAGAGASRHFCKQMICAIYRSIDQGLMGYKHFEEIGIFEEGIGCDRISDITCNILKEEFIDGKSFKNLCGTNNTARFLYLFQSSMTFPLIQRKFSKSNLNGFIAFARAWAAEKRQATFLGIVYAVFFYNFRIEHYSVSRYPSTFIEKSDYSFFHTSHIRCHADTTILVRNQRIEQILCDE
jgi:hypothetical protein